MWPVLMLLVDNVFSVIDIYVIGAPNEMRRSWNDALYANDDSNDENVRESVPFGSIGTTLHSTTLYAYSC